VTAQNGDRETPLQPASQWGQVDVARMLIVRGADATAQNWTGDTPLHLTSALPSWAWISPHKFAEMAHMLLEHGADINAQNENGLTPFVLASQFGSAEITDVLVEHGADPGAHDDANRIHSGGNVRV
jgi:uncharacterized protein